MQETFVVIAETVELLLELALVLIVSVGALIALGKLALSLGRTDQMVRRREAWTTFASWLLLALEFALAADLVGTAITPTWDDVGQLGVIAIIRIALGFFLEREIDSFSRTRLGGGSEAE